MPGTSHKSPDIQRDRIIRLFYKRSFRVISYQHKITIPLGCCPGCCILEVIFPIMFYHPTAFRTGLPFEIIFQLPGLQLPSQFMLSEMIPGACIHICYTRTQYTLRLRDNLLFLHIIFKTFSRAS